MIPEHLRGYLWRIDRILSAMHEWISQDEFDAFVMRQDFAPGCVDRTSDGMVILHPENPWLSLLIEMVRSELVEARETDGRIYYRAKAMMRGQRS